MARLYAFGDVSFNDNRVYTLDNAGNQKQLGNRLPIQETYATAGNQVQGITKQWQRVVNAAGSTYIVYATGILKLNETTNNWNVVYSNSSWASNNQKSPPIVMSVSGIPHIVGSVQSTTADSWIFYRHNVLNDTTMNSALINVVNAAVYSDWVQAVAVTGQYTMLRGTFGFLRHSTYNPITNGATSTTIAGHWGNLNDLVVHNGRVWYFWQVSNAANVYYFNITPGTSSAAGWEVSPIGRAHSNHTEGAVCGFSDGDYLYGMYWSNVGAWSISKSTVDRTTHVITSTENITSRTIPYAIGYSSVNYGSVRTFYDSDTDSRYFLISRLNDQSITQSYPMELWKWNGPDAYLTRVGTIPGAGRIISFSNDGGGDKTYRTTRLNSVVTDIQNAGTPGDFVISFRVFETATLPLGTPVTVSFAYSTPATHPTEGQASLKVGTSNAGSVIQNKIYGLTANSGNLYTVEWRGFTQGVRSGQSVILTPIVEVAL